MSPEEFAALPEHLRALVSVMLIVGVANVLFGTMRLVEAWWRERHMRKHGIIHGRRHYTWQELRARCEQPDLKLRL